MEVDTAQRLQSRRLLVYGTVLFLVGLVNGLFIPAVPDTRRALSAHLVGVQDGMVLWAFGLMWDRVNLRPRVRALVIASAIYSMYAIWIGLALAVVDPDSAGASAPILSAAVALSETSGSLAILGASAGVITGLVMPKRQMVSDPPRDALAAGEKT